MPSRDKPSPAVPSWEGANTSGAASDTTLVGAETTTPTEKYLGDTASAKPRQPRPLKVDAHYPVARMTYLTISTEELATLGISSGAGSLALSFAFYFSREAYSTGESLAYFGAAGFIAAAVVAYILFGGLLRRIRTRSDLSPWKIFSE